jgi:hypothetical protein
MAPGSMAGTAIVALGADAAGGLEGSALEAGAPEDDAEEEAGDPAGAELFSGALDVTGEGRAGVDSARDSPRSGAAALSRGIEPAGGDASEPPSIGAAAAGCCASATGSDEMGGVKAGAAGADGLGAAD